MPAVTSTPRVVREFGDETRAFASYGFFSFRRTGDLVPWRGDLAYDYLTCACLDPKVLRVGRDVAPIQWFDGVRWRTHEPLYRVVRRGDAAGLEESLHVDVTWSWVRERDARKYRRVEAEAKAANVPYRLLDERDVRVMPRLTNAMIVQSRAGEGIVPDADARALREYVGFLPSFTLRQVIDGTILDYGRAYSAVLNRVATGDFVIDLGILFGADAEVTNRNPF